MALGVQFIISVVLYIIILAIFFKIAYTYRSLSFKIPKINRC